MSDDDEGSDADFIKFPSIGHLKGLYRELPFVTFPDGLNRNEIEFEGTVKLHGSHCDIVSKSKTSLDLISQSRNRIITPDLDNCGFAKFVEKNRTTLLKMIDTIRHRTSGTSVMISGEICGRGVQSNVGISQQAEKFVVILQVRVDGLWQPPTIWEDLSESDNRIFNIRHFPLYSVMIDTNDTMKSLTDIEKMTRGVGDDCPVAAALGTAGPGEGIVWVPKNPVLGAHSRLWFKSKTEEHMVTPPKNRAPRPVSQADIAAVEFVDDNLTSARMEQGLDYLREFNLDATMQNMGTFLKWVSDDILKECGQDIDKDVQKASKKIIANRAKNWYMSKIT